MRSSQSNDPAGTDDTPANPTPGPAPVPGALTRKEAVPQPAAAHRPPLDALSPTLNILGLLFALRRRWRAALGLGLLLGAAAAAAMWQMRPITYSGRTKLHVAAVTPKVVFDTTDPRTDFESYQRVQVALVRSRFVLNSALRDPKVAALPSVQKQADPVDWLEGIVQADFSSAPEVLCITIPGREPQDLKVLVAAVRDAYVREIVNRESKLRQDRLKQLRELHDEHDKILKGKRETLKRMAKSLGSRDRKLLATKQELTLRHINELQSELSKRQSELRTAQLELTLHQAKEKAAETLTVSERAVEEQLDADPLVVQYRKEIAEQEGVVAHWKRKFQKPKSEPVYRRAVARLAETKKLLAERRQRLGPALVEQARQKSRVDLQAARLQQQDKVAFLKEMERVLGEEINRRSKEVTFLKDGTVDLEWLQDEIDRVNAVSKEVGRQKDVLEVEMAAPPRVTEMEEAVVTPSQTQSGRIRLAGMAGLGGFAAALFGIAFLEFRARRVSSVEEVTQGLKMKLVGALPTLPRRAMNRAAGPKGVRWQNRLTESVDAIRTMLTNAARFEGLRVVMVTSAVGGEGKTLLACHLAASLARAGRKTLLIDADLRRPSIHKLFGLSSECGLGEVLRQQLEASQAVQPGLVDGLSVITAGQSGKAAVQALARHGMGEILKGLRESYDFIVIDTAPVLPVADSQAIGQHVDGVVFSVMRDVSRLPEVYAACERLHSLRVRIVGAVVNGATGGAYGCAYSYSTPAEAGQKV